MRYILLLLLALPIYAEEFSDGFGTVYTIEEEYAVAVISLKEDWWSKTVELVVKDEKMTLTQIERLLCRKINQQDWDFYHKFGRFKLFLSDRII